MTFPAQFGIIAFAAERYAGVAELADALDSGSNGRKAVQVQVLLPAPKHSNPNLLTIGESFGFVFYFTYPNFNTNIKNSEGKDK